MRFGQRHDGRRYGDQPLLNGTCVYLEEGDLAVNMVKNQTKNPCFPLEYYSGVSIVIDLARAEHSLSGVLKDISIDLCALREKLCAGNRCFVMRATDSIEHIFSELYTVPDQVKFGYFKLKVLELLLFLSVINPDEHLAAPRYFQKNQVECVKRMKNYMVCHPDCHFTLQELSERFDLPMTTMKQCFKGIYVYALLPHAAGRRAAVPEQRKRFLRRVEAGVCQREQIRLRVQAGDGPFADGIPQKTSSEWSGNCPRGVEASAASGV